MRRDEGSWPCLHPWISLQVLDGQGNCYPCCFSRTLLGNINRDSVADIWNGPAAQGLREDVARGQHRSHCRPHCPILEDMNDRPGRDLLHYALGLKGPLGDNAAALSDSYLARHPEVSATPLYLRVFPTNRCGIRCAMCHIWSATPKVDVGIPLAFMPLLPQAAALEAIAGEPFLSAKWLEFIRDDLGAYPGLKLRAITNGKFLNSDVIANRLPSPERWSWLGYSFDTRDQSTLRHLRSGVSVETLQRNLMAIVDYSRSIFPITILTTLMKSNLSQIRDLVGWAMDQFGLFPQVTVALSLVRGRWHDEGDFSGDDRSLILELCSEFSSLGGRVRNLNVVKKTVLHDIEQDSRPETGWRHLDADIDPRSRQSE